MDEKVVKLKNDLKNRGIKGLALDIDETLSDSNTHWFEHMFKFHKPENFTVDEIIEKYQIIEHVPEPKWQTEEAYEYLNQALHSNKFNEEIPLITDADSIVRKLNKEIPIVAYITARPETIITGTKKWLHKHKFPEAEVVTQSSEVKASKDHFILRNSWKSLVLDYLYPEVMGIVDDNVGLAYELKKIGYKGTQYLYGTNTDEFKGYKNVIVCPTWQDVLKAIVR